MTRTANDVAKGTWVFVCGPSGSGKDSVIRWAQQALPDRTGIVFTRRYITRPAHAGSDHDPVSRNEFHAMVQSGQLRWHWAAHGFDYGVSQHHENDIAQGKLVVVNGSREHVQGLVRSPRLRVVQITANHTQLSQRLTARGRDSEEAVAHRLQRNAALGDLASDLLIVNDADLAYAGRQLADYLVSAAVAVGVAPVTAKRNFSSSAS